MRGLEPQGLVRCRGCAGLGSSVTTTWLVLWLIAVSRVPDRSAARRPALPNVGAVGWWLVGGGGCPEEAGELAGDRDGHDTVRFAARFHLPVDAMEPVLGRVRDLQHGLRLPLLAGL